VPNEPAWAHRAYVARHHFGTERRPPAGAATAPLLRTGGVMRPHGTWRPVAAEQVLGAGDAPWSGGAAPARSALLRHPSGASPGSDSRRESEPGAKFGRLFPRTGVTRNANGLRRTERQEGRERARGRVELHTMPKAFLGRARGSWFGGATEPLCACPMKLTRHSCYAIVEFEVACS